MRYRATARVMQPIQTEFEAEDFTGALAQAQVWAQTMREDSGGPVELTGVSLTDQGAPAPARKRRTRKAQQDDAQPPADGQAASPERAAADQADQAKEVQHQGEPLPPPPPMSPFPVQPPAQPPAQQARPGVTALPGCPSCTGVLERVEGANGLWCPRCNQLVAPAQTIPVVPVT